MLYVEWIAEDYVVCSKIYDKSLYDKQTFFALNLNNESMFLVASPYFRLKVRFT